MDSWIDYVCIGSPNEITLSSYLNPNRNPPSYNPAELPEDMQAMQTPFAHYLLPELKKIRMENRERNALNTPRPYRRTIP